MVDARKGKMVLHHGQVSKVKVVLPIRFQKLLKRIFGVGSFNKRSKEAVRMTLKVSQNFEEMIKPSPSPLIGLSKLE